MAVKVVKSGVHEFVRVGKRTGRNDCRVRNKNNIYNK